MATKNENSLNCCKNFVISNFGTKLCNWLSRNKLFFSIIKRKILNMYECETWHKLFLVHHEVTRECLVHTINNVCLVVIIFINISYLNCTSGLGSYNFWTSNSYSKIVQSDHFKQWIQCSDLLLFFFLFSSKSTKSYSKVLLPWGQNIWKIGLMDFICINKMSLWFTPDISAWLCNDADESFCEKRPCTCIFD